jgi:uncharacterized membrane protein
MEWFTGGRIDDLFALRFIFDNPLGTAASVLVMLLGTALIGTLYFKTLRRQPGNTRQKLTVLRTLAVLILLFLLMNPTLVGQRMEQGDQTVVLLFDDSKSMKTVSENGQTRGQNLIDSYTRAAPEFEERLSRKYSFFKYRFGEGTERLSSLSSLKFDQAQTDLFGTLHSIVQEWQEDEIAAAVIFSDGIQQPAEPAHAMDFLRNLSFPVYTVGVDSESRWRDLAIENVSVRHTHFDESPLVLTLNLKASGLRGETAIVDVLENGSIVKTEEVTFNQDEQVYPLQMEWKPLEQDWLVYQVRAHLEDQEIPADETQQQESEQSKGKLHTRDRVRENNSKRFVVDNTKKQYRILYISAHPNWEHKFLRAALQEDEQLRFTSLICISAGEQKFEYRGARTSMTNPLFEGFEQDMSRYGRYDQPIFLRLGAAEHELTDGFPTSAEELFEYQLLILGDINQKLFTSHQFELIREFVAKRGGSLLVLGGTENFSERGIQNTPIESMLPVILPSRDDGSYISQTPIQVLPTYEGEWMGALSLDAQPSQSLEQWKQMPPIFGLNIFSLTRAGATTWAETLHNSQDLQDQPLLTIQRYGLGRCAVLATGETWYWHMNTTEEPSPHARLWRQMLRILVNEVPDPIELRSVQDTYPSGNPVPLDLLVRNREFHPEEGMNLQILLQKPSGDEMALPADESLLESGVYTSEFTPEETGEYLLKVTTEARGDEKPQSFEHALLVEADQREFLKPQLNAALLQEIASRTGGVYSTLDNFSQIARTIPWEPKEESQYVKVQLWYNPFFFLLIPLLLGVEWYLRRKRGMA